MGLGVAWVKVIRLVLVTASFLLIVYPHIMGKTETFFREQAKTLSEQAKAQNQKSPLSLEEAAGLTADFGHMLVTLTLGVLVLGTAYPVVSIILLSRPSAAAACDWATRKPRQFD